MKIIKILLIFCLSYFLISCQTTTTNQPTQQPTQFETGDDVSEPPGCTELRKRGGDC
jgi:hypothetical protein